MCLQLAYMFLPQQNLITVFEHVPHIDLGKIFAPRISFHHTLILLYEPHIHLRCHFMPKFQQCILLSLQNLRLTRLNGEWALLHVIGKQHNLKRQSRFLLENKLKWREASSSSWQYTQATYCISQHIIPLSTWAHGYQTPNARFDFTVIPFNQTIGTWVHGGDRHTFYAELCT